ncbi:MAG: flagellin [Candidatus Sumerlaeota bacterium]|nr:flagellin [Candidatus Sumerlaeota bacterium]
MRITNNAIFEAFRNNLQRVSKGLMDSQEVMSTQKRVNRVSDDPLGASVIQLTTRQLNGVNQYVRNIGLVESNSKIVDAQLSQCDELLSRAKELMLSQANNATTSSDTRQAVAAEMVSLRQQLLSIANTRIGSRYLFAGTADTQQPFDPMTVTSTAGAGNTGGATATAQAANEAAMTGHAYRIAFTAPNLYDVLDVTTGATISSGNAYASGGNISFDGLLVTVTNNPGAPAAGDVFNISTTLPGVYHGNSNEMQVEIEQSSRVAYSLPGDRVFQGAGLPAGVNLFTTLNNAIDALRSNDATAIDAALNQLDQASHQINNERAVIGARMNRYDSAQTRLQAQSVEMQSQRSLIQDADLVDAATEYNRQEVAYKAALSVTGQIGQLSLLDFLQ